VDALTMVIEVIGRDAEEAENRAYALVCATMRLLPSRPELTMSLSDENRYEFTGDEDSLRLLLALGEARRHTNDLDTFEEACGIVDGPRTRLGAVPSHVA
jgi:hypothetical protein